MLPSHEEKASGAHGTGNKCIKNEKRVGNPGPSTDRVGGMGSSLKARKSRREGVEGERRDREEVRDYWFFFIGIWRCEFDVFDF